MPLIIPPMGVYALGQFASDRRTFQIPSPPVIRADAIDQVEQEFTSFAKDADPIDAQVVNALWRVRESGAAVLNTGARFLDIDKLTDRAPNEIQAEARFALRRLIERGDITLLDAVVESGSDFAELVVDYINNRTPVENKTRKARVRVPEGARNGQTR